jgi:biopolymer transport protein ExbB
MSEIWVLIKQGGILMIPIILCSLLSFMVFFERLWSLQRNKIIPTHFVSLIFSKLEQGNVKDALVLCESNQSPASVVIASGLKVVYKKQNKNQLEKIESFRANIKEAFEEIGQIEIAYLGKMIELLGTIATITPLLGLLGTVLGMIDVFKAVVSEASVQSAAVNPASLANGIWIALITTVAGLSAAIPAFVCYKYLLSRVEQLAVELEEMSLAILELLCGEKESPHDTTIHPNVES